MNFLSLLVIGGLTVRAQGNGWWLIPDKTNEENARLKSGQRSKDLDSALSRRLRFAMAPLVSPLVNGTANDTLPFGPQGPLNSSDPSDAATGDDGRRWSDAPPRDKPLPFQKPAHKSPVIQKPSEPFTPKIEQPPDKKVDEQPKQKFTDPPSPQTSSSKQTGKSSTVLYVIGGIVGFVVVVLLLVGIWWLVKRQRQKNPPIGIDQKIVDQEKFAGDAKKSLDYSAEVFLIKSAKEPEKAESQIERPAQEVPKSLDIFAPKKEPIVKMDKKSVSSKLTSETSSSSSTSSSSEEEGSKSGAKSVTKSSTPSSPTTSSPSFGGNKKTTV